MPSSKPINLGPERLVLLHSPDSLGVELQHCPLDGHVRIVNVATDETLPMIDGKINCGDVICEAASVDMRKPITSSMWKLTLGLIEVAPRPIEIVVATELTHAAPGEMPLGLAQLRTAGHSTPPTVKHSINCDNHANGEVKKRKGVTSDDEQDSADDGSYYQLEFNSSPDVAAGNSGDVLCHSSPQDSAQAPHGAQIQTPLLKKYFIHHITPLLQGAQGKANLLPSSTTAAESAEAENPNSQKSPHATGHDPSTATAVNDTVPTTAGNRGNDESLSTNPFLDDDRFGPCRTIIFHTQSLGVKLHRSPTEGLVHILHVTPYKPFGSTNDPPPREGDDGGYLEAGDAIMEVGGVNIRGKSIGAQEWADMIHFIKNVGRPLDMIVAKDKLFTRERAGVVLDGIAGQVMIKHQQHKDQQEQPKPERHALLEQVEEVQEKAELQKGVNSREMCETNETIGSRTMSVGQEKRQQESGCENHVNDGIPKNQRQIEDSDTSLMSGEKQLEDPIYEHEQYEDGLDDVGQQLLHETQSQDCDQVDKESVPTEDGQRPQCTESCEEEPSVSLVSPNDTTREMNTCGSCTPTEHTVKMISPVNSVASSVVPFSTDPKNQSAVEKPEQSLEPHAAGQDSTKDVDARIGDDLSPPTPAILTTPKEMNVDNSLQDCHLDDIIANTVVEISMSDEDESNMSKNDCESVITDDAEAANNTFQDAYQDNISCHQSSVEDPAQDLRSLNDENSTRSPKSEMPLIDKAPTSDSSLVHVFLNQVHNVKGNATNLHTSGGSPPPRGAFEVFQPSSNYDHPREDNQVVDHKKSEDVEFSQNRSNLVSQDTKETMTGTVSGKFTEKEGSCGDEHANKCSGLLSHQEDELSTVSDNKCNYYGSFSDVDTEPEEMNKAGVGSPKPHSSHVKHMPTHTSPIPIEKLSTASQSRSQPALNILIDDPDRTDSSMRKSVAQLRGLFSPIVVTKRTDPPSNSIQPLSHNPTIMKKPRWFKSSVSNHLSSSTIPSQAPKDKSIKELEPSEVDKGTSSSKEPYTEKANHTNRQLWKGTPHLFGSGSGISLGKNDALAKSPEATGFSEDFTNGTESQLKGSMASDNQAKDMCNVVADVPLGEDESEPNGPSVHTGTEKISIERLRKLFEDGHANTVDNGRITVSNNKSGNTLTNGGRSKSNSKYGTAPNSNHSNRIGNVAIITPDQRDKNAGEKLDACGSSVRIYSGWSEAPLAESGSNKNDSPKNSTTNLIPVYSTPISEKEFSDKIDLRSKPVGTSPPCTNEPAKDSIQLSECRDDQHTDHTGKRKVTNANSSAENLDGSSIQTNDTTRFSRGFPANEEERSHKSESRDQDIEHTMITAPIHSLTPNSQLDDRDESPTKTQASSIVLDSDTLLSKERNQHDDGGIHGRTAVRSTTPPPGNKFQANLSTSQVSLWDEKSLSPTEETHNHKFLSTKSSFLIDPSFSTPSKNRASFSRYSFHVDDKDSPFVGNIKFESPEERAAAPALFAKAFVVQKREANTDHVEETKPSVEWDDNESPTFVVKKFLPEGVNGEGANSSYLQFESPVERSPIQDDLFPAPAVIELDPVALNLTHLSLQEEATTESNGSFSDDPTWNPSETVVYADESFEARGGLHNDCCGFDFCTDTLFESLVQDCGDMDFYRKKKEKANKIPSPNRKKNVGKSVAKGWKKVRLGRKKDKNNLYYGTLKDETEPSERIKSASAQLTYQNFHGQSLAAAQEYSLLDDDESI